MNPIRTVVAPTDLSALARAIRTRGFAEKGFVDAKP